MKIFQRVQEIWRWGDEMQGANMWPSIATLALGLHGLVMSFADILCIVNIWLKFNENTFRDKGDMERIYNTRLKHVILDCDLDLESAFYKS